jgi:hypothetical protein
VKRPFYLLTHGVEVEELLTVVTKRESVGLASRILLTAPGPSSPSDPVADRLDIRYSETFSSDPVEPFGVAQIYDAYYLLSYALAAVRNTDVIGRDLRAGLVTILGFDAGLAPSVVEVGPNDIDETFALVRSAKPIQVHGASGAFAFDPAKAASPSDIHVECITTTGGTSAFHLALVFHSSTASFESITDPQCPP